MSAIDLTRDTAAATIATAAKGLAGFTIYPATDTIYLGSWFTNVMTVISGASNTVTATIKLPAGVLADSLALDPGTGLLYAGTYKNGILVIDPASGSVTATIASAIHFHLSLTLDATHHVLYAEPFGGNQVLVIATTTGLVTTRFPVTKTAGGNGALALSGTGDTLFTQVPFAPAFQISPAADAEHGSSTMSVPLAVPFRPRRRSCPAPAVRCCR